MIFSWPGGPAAIEPTLAGVLDRAEDAGIHSIWPMDHFFQIPAAGEGPDAPMLEGWATIAWAAGRTRTLQLGTLVTGVHYRHPGLLAKFATTLRHKFGVLRRHCEDAGRSYDAIAKTTTGRLGDDRDLGRVSARFAALADLGVDLAIVDLPDAQNPSVFDFLGELARELEPLGRAAPAILGG